MTDPDDVDPVTEPPAVAPRRDHDDGLASPRYPRIVRNDAPEGLKRREARRWRTADRKRQVAASRAAARSWGLEGAAIDGLAPVALVGALVVAAVVWFGTTDRDPAPAPDRPAATATTAPSPAPGTAPATTVPLPAADPSLPAPFDARGGALARELVLAWNTYDPSGPDPVGTWIGSWSPLATPVVASTARDDAPRLWDSALTNQVTVGFPVVLDGGVVNVVSGRSATFTVTVQRTLTPLAGGAVTTDTRDWRVTVTGDRVTQVMDAPTGISE